MPTLAPHALQRPRRRVLLETTLRAGACALLGSVSVFAGGSSESALLIVDPGRPESLYIANVYRATRSLPAQNLLYMTPEASNYGELTQVQLPAFLAAVETGGLELVDYVILPPGGGFRIPAAGLVSDSCSPVNHFALASAYGLARQADTIQAGVSVGFSNEYARSNWSARAFSSRTSWLNGLPSEDANAQRYFIGTMLGYTGANGNTLNDILDLIARSAPVDGSHPSGSVYYMETTDQARSGPRHDFYPDAVTQMLSAGGAAQHLLAVLPSGQHDCMGIMTGWASPGIDAADMTLLPGSFCDHLDELRGHLHDDFADEDVALDRQGCQRNGGHGRRALQLRGQVPPRARARLDSQRTRARRGVVAQSRLRALSESLLRRSPDATLRATSAGRLELAGKSPQR